MKTLPVSATLNRDQAFTFVSWLLSQWTERGFAVSGAQTERDELYGWALVHFLEAFPRSASENVPALYARLSHPPDRLVLRSFLHRLNELALDGPGRGELSKCKGEEWQWARIAWELRKLHEREKPELPRSAVPYNHWIPKVTPALAFAAFTRVRTGGRKQEDDVILEAAVERWRKATRNIRRDRLTCHKCAKENLNPLRPEDHVPFCEAHPARARLAAAETAARLDGGLDALIGLVKNKPFAPPERETWLGSTNVKDALEHLLLPPGSDGKKSPRARFSSNYKPAEVVLLSALLEWEASTLKERVCPLCNAVFATEALEAHLWKCESHPYAQAAAVIEQMLARGRGHDVQLSLRITEAHERVWSALQALANKAKWFDSELGWTGDCAYSDVGSEEPWLSALSRGGEAIKAFEHEKERFASSVALPAAIARLRDKTVQAEVALQRLVKGCRSFWNGASDGEYGKSLYRDDSCRVFSALVDETLKEVERIETEFV